jgi:hypothetical protein
MASAMIRGALAEQHKAIMHMYSQIWPPYLFVAEQQCGFERGSCMGRDAYTVQIENEQERDGSTRGVDHIAFLVWRATIVTENNHAFLKKEPAPTLDQLEWAIGGILRDESVSAAHLALAAWALKCLDVVGDAL